jgi:2-oxoisovalerate dehydrogenase E1 component
MLVNADLVALRAKEVIGGKATPPWRWKGRTDGMQADITIAAPAAAKAAAPAAAEPTIAGEPIKMPFGDLTVDSGKLVRWTVAPGAAVKKGETVAEIETDKAVVEIEAPATGTITQLVTEPGTIVKMGGTIGAVQ